MISKIQYLSSSQNVNGDVWGAEAPTNFQTQAFHTLKFNSLIAPGSQDLSPIRVDFSSVDQAVLSSRTFEDPAVFFNNESN